MTPTVKGGGTLAATAALVAATAVWGSTFIVTKSSLDEIEPASFLTWRFGIGAVALLLIRPLATIRLSRAEVWRSGLLGVALAAGFLLQTTGLQHTLAGVSGFLTGAAVILTPVGIAALTGGVSAPTSVGALSPSPARPASRSTSPG